MGGYTKARALALRLIGKKGRAIQVRRIENAAPAEPGKPWSKGRDSSDHATTGVFLAYKQKRQEGASIKVADQEVLIPAADLDFVPTTKDKIIDTNGSVWNIVGVDPLQPGDEAVVFTVQVRR